MKIIDLRSTVLLLVTIAALVSTSYAAKLRDEIPEQYKWDFTHAYASWDDWVADMEIVGEMVDEFEGLQNSLNPENPQSLLTYLEKRVEVARRVSKISSYSSLRSSVNLRDEVAASNYLKGQALRTRYFQARSWYEPALLSLGKERVEGWISTTPGLEEWRHPLMEKFRLASHTLSAEQEELLSAVSTPLGASGSIYNKLSASDLPYPEIILSNGDTTKATYGLYNKISLTGNREDRKKAFDGYYGTFRNFQTTMASTFKGMLSKELFYANARKYSSAAEMNMEPDAVSIDVHALLVKSAQEGNNPLKRYHQLRKKALGLNDYFYYDIEAPLVDQEMVFSFDDAYDNLIDAVTPFGKEYKEYVKRGYEERWVDVYESPAKWFNAYCGFIEFTHPYILMNYSDNIGSANTLAHEMGHAVHSMLSRKYQPYPTRGYSSVAAECAAYMNQLLLHDELMDNTDSPEVRILLIQHLMDNIGLSFYRQAMLGDFEMKAHNAMAEGTPITASSLNGMFLGSLQDMYGDAIENLEEIDIFWASKPHYYNPFYVHQYAISWTATIALHKNMIEGKRKDKKAAIERYLTLLKSGGKDHYIELFKTAGVDLTTEDPYLAVVEYMNELAGQLEKELIEVGKIDE